MIMMHIVSQNGNVTVPVNQIYCQILHCYLFCFIILQDITSLGVKLVFGLLMILICIPSIDILGCDVM